ncbi:MAG: hypothetical protein ACYC91_19630 [Solirubrobacteraceae bacterium]
MIQSTSRAPAASSTTVPLPASDSLDDRLLIICALSCATGLIHAEAALEHLHEYALYALFFAVLAPLQIAWGIMVYRQPTPARVAIGAVASLLIAALWVTSRTTGLPIGQKPWTPESVGAADVLATVSEVTIALLATTCRRSQTRPALPHSLARVLNSLGPCLIALSVLALTITGH